MSAVRDLLDGTFKTTAGRSRQGAASSRPAAALGGPEWPVIGQERELVYIKPDQVLDIHWQLVEDFARANDPIDPPGPRSEALLESAVYRPHTALGGQRKYPTVEMAGAALFHSLVQDHPFHNGNKRTALVSLIAFLDMNGELLEVEDDDLFDYVVRLADHRLLGRHANGDGSLADQEGLEVADWIDCNSRSLEKQEQRLQFRELQAILRGYGAEFKPRKGCRMIIRRGDLQSHISWAGMGRDVERNTIHKVRKDLELDEEHHVDSAVFYRGHRGIPAFIQNYRDVLERLAKT
jgi:death-on-curing family protein